MRLDKVLAHLNYGSRKEVKSYIRKGFVLVNGNVITDDDYKVDEASDEIVILDQVVDYQSLLYFVLNKPKNAVCATYDKTDPIVLDWIDCKQKGLFPVGRLDKDTTGFLLITNDGKLAHELLSPKHHVDKVYEVSFTGEFQSHYFEIFKRGVQLEDGYLCKPAYFELLDPQRGRITIHEGKFHQIKRMFQALQLEVTELKRISFAGMPLPKELKEGEYRALTKEEIEYLRKWNK